MEGIEFIVAPYEADAQLAFLSRSGRVDAVITEDSDLIAYGCKRVLFKMNSQGEGQEICLQDLPKGLCNDERGWMCLSVGVVCWKKRQT